MADCDKRSVGFGQQPRRHVGDGGVAGEVGVQDGAVQRLGQRTPDPGIGQKAGDQDPGHASSSAAWAASIGPAAIILRAFMWMRAPLIVSTAVSRS